MARDKDEEQVLKEFHDHTMCTHDFSSTYPKMDYSSCWRHACRKSSQVYFKSSNKL